MGRGIVSISLGSLMDTPDDGRFDINLIRQAGDVIHPAFGRMSSLCIPHLF